MGHADATYAPKYAKRMFVSGVAMTCRGAATQSISRTHKCTMHSSIEAEHVAMTEGFTRLPFMRYVWRFLCPGFWDPCAQVLRTTRVPSRW